MEPPMLARAFVVALVSAIALSASAQTGVSDDRVSLPDGPGSLDGMGDNTSFNPAMGTFSYSVAIEVPDGDDGLTPDPSLSYSSGGGASVAGIGWSMDMPFIERMTSRGLPDYEAESPLRWARGSLTTV